MLGVTFMANGQTNRKLSKNEKAFNKSHRILIKAYIEENKSIKAYYRCDKIKDSKKQLQCYSHYEKEVIRNLKWFDKTEAKLIKKFGDGVSVFAYKY